MVIVMMLKEKVAIITGAASGIGKATAVLMVEEGAKVIAADIDIKGAKDLAAKFGENVIPFQVDVSKPDEVSNMVDFAIDQWNGLDILFNNAGLVENDSSVTELNPEVLDKMLEVNIKGVVWGCRYAIPAMIERGGGSIINNASVLGLSGMRKMAAYCATKGAVVSLTRQVALDYASFKIRVNCVCPGGVLTEKRLQYHQTMPDPVSSLNEANMRFPLGRFVSPEDVASTVLFLAGEASSFITGVALPVDGGCLVNYNGI